VAKMISIVDESENSLTWKFAKVLAGGSVLASLLWWSPIPLDVLAQVVLMIALPIILVAAFVGLTSFDAVQSTWNAFAKGDFTARVQAHLDKMEDHPFARA